MSASWVGFVRFLGEVTAQQFCFEIYWPSMSSKSVEIFFPWSNDLKRWNKNWNGSQMYLLHFLKECIFCSMLWIHFSSKKGRTFMMFRFSTLKWHEKLNYVPSSIYVWFLKPLYVLHSQFPNNKSWVVAYFINFFKFFQKFFIKAILRNFSMRTLKCF